MIADVFPDPLLILPDAGPAIFGGGCFWCTEAAFRAVPGVTNVESGYTGGAAHTANYKAVCGGDTGHVEVIRVSFDPQKVSYAQLLKIFFWLAHDPTQPDGQGADIGPQYRSAIFACNDEQKKMAQAYIIQLNNAQVFDRPVITRVETLETFYMAEDYHQNYAALNPGQPYIRGVAQPKIDKVRAAHK